MRARRLTDPLEAGRLLGQGRLVAFPTETVYGLGADATDARAVAAVFAAKGRPADNPLILHVATPREARSVAVWNARAEELARRFWPGPLTLVLPAAADVGAAVRAGRPTVAVRCPDHPLAREVLAAVGRPVAAPSANRSGRPSPTTAAAVLDELGDRIDAVLDGGPCRYGLESTVVDASGPELRLLRLGATPAEALGLEPRADADVQGLSPGTRHRHYAPAIPVHVVADLETGLRVHPDAAVLCGAADASRLGLRPGPAVCVLPDDPAGRAAGLFAALRRLERSGRSCIVAPQLTPTGLDAATADRLRRAAQP